MFLNAKERAELNELRNEIRGRITEIYLENWYIDSTADPLFAELNDLKYIDALRELKALCKSFNCSADYVLGLSDKYWGG